MKILKKALLTIMAGALLLSSSNAFASGEEISNTVEANKMWRFMWPQEYQIIKIHTEGCDIDCLKTYIVNDGFLSEFIPDNNTDELVKVFALTEDGTVLKVVIKVIRNSDGSYTDIITETTTGATTETTNDATTITDVTMITESTTTTKAATVTTACYSTCCTTDKNASISSSSFVSPREYSDNTPSCDSSDNTDAKIADDSHSDYQGGSSAGNGNTGSHVSARPVGSEDGTKTAFGSFIFGDDINTIEKEDFIQCENYLSGDLNLDRKVELTDLTILSVTVMRKTELEGVKRRNADIDGNNIVDIADLARLKQIILKDPAAKVSDQPNIIIIMR